MPLRAMMSGLARKLDRPGTRWLLRYMFLLAARWERTPLHSLRFSDGWIHRFGDQYLVEDRPRLRADEIKRSNVHHYCCTLYVPRDGDVFVDVGAGYGWESMLLAGEVGPSGRVIAIEAHPLLAAMMQRTFELNHLDNAVALNLAAGARAETLFIENDLISHLGNAVSLVSDSNRIAVEAKPLDELCRELSIDRIDLLKMNIEGAEQMAIGGMTETIRRTAVVAISCHDFKFAQTGNQFFRTRALIEQWLTDQGFVIVPRQSELPWLNDQVNAYNPQLTDPSRLNPSAFVASPS